MVYPKRYALRTKWLPIKSFAWKAPESAVTIKAFVWDATTIRHT